MSEKRELVQGAYYAVRQDGRVGLLRWNEHAGLFEPELWSVGPESGPEVGPRIEPDSLFVSEWVVSFTPAESGIVEVVDANLVYTPPSGDREGDTFVYGVAMTGRGLESRHPVPEPRGPAATLPGQPDLPPEPDIPRVLVEIDGGLYALRPERDITPYESAMLALFLRWEDRDGADGLAPWLAEHGLLRHFESVKEDASE